MTDAALIPARLAWQCRRGMRELDLLLEGFLRHTYPLLDERQQHDFVRLLAYPDQLLFEFLMGQLRPSDPAMAQLVDRVRKQAMTNG